MVCSHGLMAENIKVNIWMIKNKDKVYLHLKMVVFIKVNGWMENNMEEVLIKRIVWLSRVFGKMAKELNGLTNRMENKIKLLLKIWNELI